MSSPMGPYEKNHLHELFMLKKRFDPLNHNDILNGDVKSIINVAKKWYLLPVKTDDHIVIFDELTGLSFALKIV